MTRTSSLLVWFGLIISASGALYHTSDRVQGLNRELKSLDAQIENEQKSIHVLNAEWAYLASPAHVEEAAKKHLALRPTAPKQITSLDNLDNRLMEHGRKSASAAAPTRLARVEAPPIASIKTASIAPAPRTLSLPKAHILTVAAVAPDYSHLSDHMIMQRTASAQSRDSISALLTQLDQEP